MGTRELRQLIADNEAWQRRPENLGQSIILDRLRSSERDHGRRSTRDGLDADTNNVIARRQRQHRTPWHPRGQEQSRSRSRSPLRSIHTEPSTASGESRRAEVQQASGIAASTSDFAFLRPSPIPPRRGHMEDAAPNRPYVLLHRLSIFTQMQEIGVMLPPAEDIRRRTLQIKDLPTREVKSEDESQSCVICITGYEIGEQVTELQCNHRFHQNCISTWLQSSPHCPLCRTHCFL
ncbi:uncharacterized protein LOC143765135 [Ranitomeya variabilis]|uniref:uncharacterized protein LOC143765135 n=1 Tax=Ranitomeya variabilis TaxID=490064 RepID=UPI004057476A